MSEQAHKIRTLLQQDAEYYEDRAKREIERNRKGFFQLYLRDAQGNPLTGQTVTLKQKSHDFNFGCNSFMIGQYPEEERNLAYREEFCKLFNLAVLSFYWEGTEPVRGELRYSNPARPLYRRPTCDNSVEFCRQNSLRMKGHPLFWHEFIPKWLPQRFEELMPLIRKRFSEIAERYADIIPTFDVVNEPSRVYDVHMRDRLLGRDLYLPDDYVERIFKIAEQYFPANHLFLNDTVGAAFYDFRGIYSGYYQEIQNLLQKGVRIDGIGLQCHAGLDKGCENLFNPKRLYQVLDIYGKFGKPIQISEIGFPSKLDGVQDEELQALFAKTLYTIAFSHPNVNGIVWWNLPDDGVATQIRGTENLPSSGLLDGKYREKQAYRVLYDLIQNQWHNDFTLQSHARSYVTLRAFYGEYEVSVNGKPQGNIHLSQDTYDELTLTVQ